MKKTQKIGLITWMIFIIVALCSLSFFGGWLVRNEVCWTAKMPEYDEPPKERTIIGCRDVWSKIDGDNRWVLTQYCEEVIDRR